MIVRIALTVLWLIVIAVAGLNGKVKLFNDDPLPPLLGMITAPIIAVLMGFVFLVTGALLLLPVLAWVF